MGNQFPKSVIDKDWQMRGVHFKMWGDGWKCDHCNFRVEWSIKKAREHSKTHLNKREERST